MMRDLKVFSGSSHPELAKAICEYNEIPLGASEIIQFSNENIMVRISYYVSCIASYFSTVIRKAFLSIVIVPVSNLFSSQC